MLSNRILNDEFKSKWEKSNHVNLLSGRFIIYILLNNNFIFRFGHHPKYPLKWNQMLTFHNSDF
jgi:hypothetical protein